MSDDKGWQLEHRVVQIIIVNIEVYVVIYLPLGLTNS
jgi:hypothetical protein